jgi:hypothetical protein
VREIDSKEAAGIKQKDFHHLNTYGGMRLRPAFLDALFPTPKSAQP